ncbi:MAG: MG2 domain-containing protein [Myxococcota bacterium]
MVVWSLLWACTGKPDAEPVSVEEQAAFAELVAAHTDGLVSRTIEPRVRFVTPVLAALPNAQPPAGTLVFDPPVEGVARWLDSQELVFDPTDTFAPNTAYTVTVDLSILGFGADQPPFRFEFATIAQAYEVEDGGLEMDDDGATRLRGTVRTTDVAEDAVIESMLSATQGKRALKASWSHLGGNRHQWTLDGITREEAATTVALAWDGQPLGVEEDRATEVAVPAKGEFGLMASRAEAGATAFVELRFTDPIAPDQNLAGRIRADGRDLRFEVQGNVVRVFASDGWAGTVTLAIDGIENRAGVALPAAVDATVSFDPILPAVRFASQGVILPTTQGLTVPIEAVNVRAVEIEATRVYETNIPRFLQANALDGSQELARVGKVVWRQRVPIEVGPEDHDRWVRLGLDVSRLVSGADGGLYHLSLRFDRPDVVYDCPTAAPDARPVAPVVDPPWDRQGSESSFWDFWGGEDGYYDRYQQRTDPCSPSYYTTWDDHDVTVSKNVVVSNVGVIAKQGEDGDLVVVVTDLRTTAPSAGAKVEVVDFQLQKMAAGETDADGVVRLHAPGHPFVIEAVVGAEHGYVKLDRAASLATGHFDTGGRALTDGLEGLLYGERGVWRPGDPIHLTFLLHDETGRLPADHPIQFELRNPSGQVVERRTVRGAVDGFYDLETKTAADAPTGPYTATVDLGGRTFTETLRIETVQPNRLKVAYDLPKDGIRAPGLALRTTLHSRWLHGAPAPNLDTRIDGKLVARPTKFPKLDGYVFDDPTAQWSSSTFTLHEGRLNGVGDEELDLPIEVADGAPGMLNLELTTRVFEPSGAFSIDQATVPVSPHQRYVGIKLPKGDVARSMLLTDTKHTVDVVMVDADGKPTGGSPIRWALYKVQWRWWWEKGEESLADYAGVDEHTALASGVADTADGKGSFQFEVKYPEWGRYLLLVTDEDGTHRTGATMYIDWPGWAGRASKDNPGGASVLTVTTDRSEVEVGQPVTLTFPTPTTGGRALISLETGTRVLKTAWVEPTAASTSVTIVATPDMAPSVYANVTLLQPHEATKNDLPIRLYGIAPITVVDRDTRLTPILTTTETWEPESTAKVAVKEEHGREMTYTLVVVDEGLLGLTRYKTPDPWATFYGREALGVRTWDVYDLVAGAYGAALEGTIAVGGDGEAEPGAQREAKRFPPMVLKLGTFHLAPGETRTHDVALPGYVGEVRLMAVAGHGRGFGSAERSITVKKPLMVLASLPRVLGPGETVTVPVDVFALDPKVDDVKVSVTVDGPAAIVGPTEQRLAFASVGDQLAEFRLQVSDALGIVKVTATAKGGGLTATHTVELQVRHPGTRQTDVLTAVVEAGKTWTTTVALAGLPGTNEAELEVSRVPPLNLGARLDALIHYPHGCVEQTTSGAFPQLMLTSVVELTADQKERIRRNVVGGITRLAQFQTSDGGYGYWPGDRTPDPWATSYVGQFLLEAERQGYPISASAKRSWLAYQKGAAGRWARTGPDAELQQAYRLYTLALAGQPDLASMNRLRDAPMGAAAKFRLASAYQLAGHPEIAKELAAGATDVAGYRELSGTYGSDLRDQALILETLILLGDPRAVPLAKTVSDRLTATSWLSTHESAVALVALSRFAGTGGTSSTLAFTWSAGGAATPVSGTRAMALIPVAIGDAQRSVPLSVGNTSSGPLFVRAITHGLPKVGEERAESDGLSLSVSYTTLDGAPLDPVHLPHGTDLVAHVTLTNDTDRALSEIAVSQGVPSGWELFGNASGAGEGYDYRDVRDDRVFTYLDLAPHASVQLSIRANAGYRGHFYLPPVAAEAMYDASVSARTEGKWVDVTDAAEG